jgi:hypothetical protein
MMTDPEDLDPVLDRAIESWRTSEAPPDVVSAALERIAARPPVRDRRRRLWPIVPVAAGVTFALVLSAAPAAWAEVATVLQAPEPLGADPGAIRSAMRPWLIVHIVAVLGAYLVFVAVWAMTQLQVVLGLCGVRRWERRVAHLAPAALAVGAGLWVAAMILGAIWARAVMGRYWGWDPKEIGAAGTLAAGLVWVALAWWLRGWSFPWPAAPALLCWLLLDIWWGSLAQAHTYGYWLSAATRCIAYGALLNVVLLVSAWWAERRS